MPHKFAFPVLVTIALILSACNLTNSTTPPAVPTNTVSIPTVAAATSTLPMATAVFNSEQHSLAHSYLSSGHCDIGSQ